MKTKFDEVYVLHLSSDVDRLTHITEQFEKLKITPYIWWTTKRDFMSRVTPGVEKEIRTGYYDGVKKEKPWVYNSVFNCMLAHYDIIKTSLERGMKRILICEDDIEFVGAKKDIEYYFNHLPDKDFGVIKYHCSSIPYTNNLTYSTYDRNIDLCSCACYALSESGMKAYIDAINRQMRPADMVFYDEEFQKDCSIYYVNRQIVDIREGNISNIA